MTIKNDTINARALVILKRLNKMGRLTKAQDIDKYRDALHRLRALAKSDNCGLVADIIDCLKYDLIMIKKGVR